MRYWKCLFVWKDQGEVTAGPEFGTMLFETESQSGSAKKAKFKTETHENNVIDIDDLLDDFERLGELPEIQEFMENMDMKVSKKNSPHPKIKQDTNTLFTTGLILEISVAIIISSESDVKSNLLNKVLIDTGCTRTIITQNELPDKFFESRKQLNEVSWTTNAGNVVTKYNFPLQLS
jgi:hypothetical protein